MTIMTKTGFNEIQPVEKDAENKIKLIKDLILEGTYRYDTLEYGNSYDNRDESYRFSDEDEGYEEDSIESWANWVDGLYYFDDVFISEILMREYKEEHTSLTPADISAIETALFEYATEAHDDYYKNAKREFFEKWNIEYDEYVRGKK